MRDQVVLCIGAVVLLCLLGTAAGSDLVGNPWFTTAAVRTLDQATLVQSEASGASEPNVGSTDALTDDALVSAKLSPSPVTLDNLKTFIKQRQFSDLGLIGDLISRSACIVRLETAVGGSLNPTSLQGYLQARELSTAGSGDDRLDRACEYQSQERSVRNLIGTPVADISTETLKVELTKLGFISTIGSKPVLVSRLGQALIDLQTIRQLTGDASLDTSTLKETMRVRGLPTEGSASELLNRFSAYLVEASGSAGMPGVSSHCDMVLASSVCLEGGKKVIAPQAAPSGLVGKWTFDDAFSQDQSGRGNHPKSAPAYGPGFNGNGASAKFDGTSMIEIPHSEHFSSPDFCVTFWLYLLGDSTGQWRTLLHKGSRDPERTPTLFLEPTTRGIELFVSTTDTNQPTGERLWSNTFVPLRRWTHIAGCVEGRNMRLYINGILDAENTTIGTPVQNQGSMFVGNDPWRQAPGGAASYMDELRYYAKALTADQIQAQAQAGLGGVESVFVELGCMGCSIDTCPKSCRRGYRLCTARDMAGGAYQVARSMGWANSETRIWTAEDVRDGADTPNASGLCMCCREEE